MDESDVNGLEDDEDEDEEAVVNLADDTSTDDTSSSSSNDGDNNDSGGGAHREGTGGDSFFDSLKPDGGNKHVYVKAAQVGGVKKRDPLAKLYDNAVLKIPKVIPSDNESLYSECNTYNNRNNNNNIKQGRKIYSVHFRCDNLFDFISRNFFHF